MKYNLLFVGLLIACLTVNLIIVPVRAETLVQEDFQHESFAKTVDFFEYARAWAVLKGLPKPLAHWHANVYMTYVNKSGFQLLYAGLQNISLVPDAYLTIPMQTILMHYKTQGENQDALVASSFLMVMGFNDTINSLYDNSPDRNDNLWASFSLGVNLQQLFPDVTFPAFTSESQIIPLEHSAVGDDVETWTWGVTYTNLTALWVTTYITEANETETSKPFGLATYDELTFKYTLTINTTKGTAVIHKDYTIGHMHDLFVFGGWFLIWPIYNHYNSTGCYRYNAKVSDETVYTFLDTHSVEMSIVEYQKTIMVNRETYTTTEEGEDVTDSEADVSNSGISTYSDTDTLIFDTDFSAKPHYNLYDDTGELISEHNNAVTRLSNVSGYARNRNLFNFQTSFQRYVPLILVSMYPHLYQRAKDTITNMEVADCLYVISYGNYSGYRIEHDPVLTAYFEPTQAIDTFASFKGQIMLATLAVPILVIIAFLRRRSKPSTTP